MNKKAIRRILDSVWTLEYKEVSETKVELIRYSQNDAEGYEHEDKLPKGDVIETDDRTVTEIEVDGKKFKVINPKYVFSYGA